MNVLLRPGWLDYNNLSNCVKSLFQPEYHISRKHLKKNCQNIKIIRFVANENEVMKLNISPISVTEEMAKGIMDKSDTECKFYESAEDVPDYRN